MAVLQAENARQEDERIDHEYVGETSKIPE
jgi:hypothetical protein